MTERYQAAADKLELLVDVLQQEGVLSDDWATALKNAGDEPGRTREVRDRHREGRGPPDWAGPPGRGGGGPPDRGDGGTAAVSAADAGAENDPPICGYPTADGSPCENKVSEPGERCHLHKDKPEPPENSTNSTNSTDSTDSTDRGGSNE